MFYRSDIQCHACKQHHIVSVEADQMPKMADRFIYECPTTGTQVSEALGTYEELRDPPVGSIPARAAR